MCGAYVAPCMRCFIFSAVQGVTGRGLGRPQVPTNACRRACGRRRGRRRGAMAGTRLVELRSAVLSVGVQVPLKEFIRMDKQRASAPL